MPNDADRDARIAALETAVADLRRELAQAQRPRMRSMRQTGRCPACGGSTLLHFRRIKDVTESGIVDLSLQKNYSAWWGVKLTAGVLEAFACKTCKLVEWNAATLDDVEPDGTDIVEVVAPAEPDAEAGPYR